MKGKMKQDIYDNNTFFEKYQEIRAREYNYNNTSISHNNGADSHIPSNMVFPTSGLWKLEIYFNEKLFWDYKRRR